MASRKGGSTSVAYWNFKDNKTVDTISLADTITNSECEISENYIAPGTEGKFDIIIDGIGSNIKIAYEINVIKEENIPSNLYFFLDNDSKHYNSLKELVNNNNFSGFININEKQERIYKVNWKWPLENIKDDGNIDEAKDLEDTNFSKKKLNYKFEIEILGKQSK